VPLFPCAFQVGILGNRIPVITWGPFSVSTTTPMGSRGMPGKRDQPSTPSTISCSFISTVFSRSITFKKRGCTPH